MKTWCRAVCALSWILTVLSFFSPSLLAEPIPLKRVVELALAHATGGEIARAEQQRAAAGYRELRNSYIPQLFTGAGLGYSYGFPLGLAGSAPSLFNLNAQSALLNPSLKNQVKAAQAESAAASLKNQDQRNQIIQDTVLSYAELAKWEQRLTHLQETEAEAGKMQAAVEQRVREGIDSELDATRARLSAARVHLRVTEAQGAADVLREHLSKLTGLPAATVQTDPDSIPATPPIPSEDAAKDSAASNPSVQAAVEHARAQYLLAQAEHKALWPSADFGAQYAVLSKFNNYENYYIPAKICPVAGISVLCAADTFRQNNATIGVSIRFPVFNASQRARAQIADADALKASKQADAARNQAAEERLRLEHTVTQMQAARDVAQLESEIAQKSLSAVETRMDSGTANIHDLDDARTLTSERFIALQDVTFELERAQLSLLRSTGDLEKWALGSQK
jgi:outer membrane protein TolC